MSLLDQALAAAHGAYAPYSEFHVGAAIETADGQIFTGNNQENSSFGLTLCAERVALVKLFSDHPDAKPLRMAVVSLDTPGGVIRPCGACLQALHEAALRSGVDIEVEMADRTLTISELLPHPF